MAEASHFDADLATETMEFIQQGTPNPRRQLFPSEILSSYPLLYDGKTLQDILVAQEQQFKHNEMVKPPKHMTPAYSRDWAASPKKDVLEKTTIGTVDHVKAHKNNNLHLENAAKFLREKETRFEEELHQVSHLEEGPADCNILCQPLVNAFALLLAYWNLFIMFLYFAHQQKLHGYLDSPRGRHLFVPRVLFFYKLAERTSLPDEPPSLRLLGATALIFIALVTIHYHGRHRDGFRIEMIMSCLNLTALLDVVLVPVDANSPSDHRIPAMVFFPLAVGIFVGTAFSTLLNVAADYVTTGLWRWHGHSNNQPLDCEVEEKPINGKLTISSKGKVYGATDNSTALRRFSLTHAHIHLTACLGILSLCVFAYVTGFVAPGRITVSEYDGYVKHVIQGTKGGPVPFVYTA